MVSRTLRGRGVAYGPWSNDRQTVFRVWADEWPRALWVSVLGTRGRGEDFRPPEHEPLSPPFLIAMERVESVYFYPPAGLSPHPPWPRQAPAEPRPYTKASPHG